ncbi:hypothetical protein [Alkalicoccobacillus plakortidis]|uniref:DUF3278 domain-containing protein n=1 Tax=Alkalicoccobacillus plakortidis TaxID=444060 RepID=A0ABT0XQ17_9BACI|nr:hypothetical protein [Alkalicoccobacillus plakortidis]MCM2678002.1 hypothetical protein [Alkalicoccobacillus plakortidis]
MRSWVSFLLPNDEYKREQILYFLTEGAFVLILYLVGILLVGDLLPILLTPQLVALIGLGLYCLYTTLRYTFSGIEFTDIARHEDYQKQVKVISVRSIGFLFTFLLLSFLFMNNSDWLSSSILALIASMFLFTLNYLSLRRSYRKNKEILD